MNPTTMELLPFLALTTVLLVKALAQDIPINTLTPMLEPSYPACAQFHLAIAGEGCDSIITAAGISLYEFFRINPAIGGEAGCQIQIFADTWYCVRSISYDPSNYDPAEPASYVTDEVPVPTEEAEPTEETEAEATTTVIEEPEITQGPAAGYCNFGDCWYEFGQLSSGNAEILQSATELCTSLFNLQCGDVNTLGFPEKIVEGCKDCAGFSSACPCWTEGKYHTYTKNRLLFDRPANHRFNWGA